MNIGDKVRMIHSSEAGIITKILNNSIIEVEIEDGFHIPVKESEVVLVSEYEARQFGNQKNIQSEEKQNPNLPFAHLGIYVAFTAINENKYAFYLINNTDYDLPFLISEEKNEQFRGLFANLLKAKNYFKIGEANIQEIDNWGIYIFQFLFFTYKNLPLRESFAKRIRFKAANLFKNKQIAPLLNKEAFLYQLDKEEDKQILYVEDEKEEAKTIIDVKKIKESMLEKKEPLPQLILPTIKKLALEIDLHIEALSKDYEKMNSAEILELQLKSFEKHLENAIAGGMNEIIFIHGLGSGKLRQEIHKQLSNHPDIKFFQDAKKEKFGYGATLVAFK